MSGVVLEVYGEDIPLSELEWTELLFRMDHLINREYPRVVVEGGEPLRRTNRRIADVAFEIAGRAVLEEVDERESGP